MNKFFTTLAILLTVVSFKLTAQGTFYPQRNYDSSINKGIVFGIKGGVNLPRLYYTNSYLKGLPQDLVFGLTGGIFVEFPLFDILAIAPEFNYQQRGGATHYTYEQYYDVKYQLQAGYLSLRVPLYCYIPVSKKIQPYVFLAPDLGYVVNGNISLSQLRQPKQSGQPELDITGSNIAVSDANINRLYAGALGGVGVRTNIALSSFTLVIKTEAALNWGFLDTFSKKEHQETAISTNVHAYNMQGKRYSRGLEVQIGFGFISNGVDGCGHFTYHKSKRK
ncbi:MAG: PorT family protein [Bacteroidales bacterium]|nr:PorT family protein [Bacteroidales bacterium]